MESATTPRQRKMYQALLDKAKKQSNSSTDSETSETTSPIQQQPPDSTKSESKPSAETTKSTKTAKTNKTTVETSQSTEPTQSTPVSTPAETKPSPQLEEEKAPPETLPEIKPPLFQAIGAIIATPFIQDELLKVTIDEHSYDLLWGRLRRKVHNLLKAELENNGSRPMLLKLYPHAQYRPSLEQPKPYFSLVAFNSECDATDESDRDFILRGIWQFIPKSSSPVISIYRNREVLGTIKKLSTPQQLSLLKPNHLPVVWDDAPVEPFKFEAQKDKNSKMKRYFVQVRASFRDGVYVVEEVLEKPTKKIPKFLKPFRKKKTKQKKSKTSQTTDSASTE